MIVLDTGQLAMCWGCDRGIGPDEYKLVLGSMEGERNVLEIYCAECAPAAGEDWDES